jgi:DNA-binding transcriptional regulator YiaG
VPRAARQTPEQVAATRAAIKRAQEATGLSQVALAGALGVDPATLRGWLYGRSGIHPSALRLCRAFALAPDLASVLDRD